MAHSTKPNVPEISSLLFTGATTVAPASVAELLKTQVPRSCFVPLERRWSLFFLDLLGARSYLRESTAIILPTISIAAAT